MIYIWRVRTRLPERFGQLFKVLARNKTVSRNDKDWYERTGRNVFTTNSCLIEFEDGYRVLTSRNYLRKAKV